MSGARYRFEDSRDLGSVDASIFARAFFARSMILMAISRLLPVRLRPSLLQILEGRDPENPQEHLMYPRH